MHIVLENMLSTVDVAEVLSIISREAFFDGQASSGLIGKRNLQLAQESQGAQAAGALVADRLMANEQFQLAVQPGYLHPPLISQYKVGMEYPEHVDNAIMGGRRADVALTVFLSDLDSYEGGDLVIATGSGERRYRLPPGHAIAYPASTLHRVARVTRGTRVAAVLWVQSMVRDPVKRAVLYELGTTTFRMAENAYSGRLRRSYANLMRLWAEA